MTSICNWKPCILQQKFLPITSFDVSVSLAWMFSHYTSSCMLWKCIKHVNSCFGFEYCMVMRPRMRNLVFWPASLSQEKKIRLVVLPWWLCGHVHSSRTVTIKTWPWYLRIVPLAPSDICKCWHLLITPCQRMTIGLCLHRPEVLRKVCNFARIGPHFVEMQENGGWVYSIAYSFGSFMAKTD